MSTGLNLTSSLMPMNSSFTSAIKVGLCNWNVDSVESGLASVASDLSSFADTNPVSSLMPFSAPFFHDGYAWGGGFESGVQALAPQTDGSRGETGTVAFEVHDTQMSLMDMAVEHPDVAVAAGIGAAFFACAVGLQVRFHHEDKKFLQRVNQEARNLECLYSRGGHVLLPVLDSFALAENGILGGIYYFVNRFLPGAPDFEPAILTNLIMINGLLLLTTLASGLFSNATKEKIERMIRSGETSQRYEKNLMMRPQREQLEELCTVYSNYQKMKVTGFHRFMNMDCMSDPAKCENFLFGGDGLLKSDVFTQMAAEQRLLVLEALMFQFYEKPELVTEKLLCELVSAYGKVSGALKTHEADISADNVRWMFFKYVAKQTVTWPARRVASLATLWDLKKRVSQHDPFNKVKS